MRQTLWIALVFTTFNVQASQGQWLNQMIAQHEGVAVPFVGEQHPKKSTDFFSTHGLILFYGSQCPHCRQFAPRVKQWAEERGAKVLPLSFDNQPLPEFPHFLPATTNWINAAYQGGPIHYPALFVVNFNHKTLYPVGFGSMSDEELNERMNALLSKISAYEHKERAS